MIKICDLRTAQNTIIIYCLYISVFDYRDASRDLAVWDTHLLHVILCSTHSGVYGRCRKSKQRNIRRDESVLILHVERPRLTIENDGQMSTFVILSYTAKPIPKKQIIQLPINQMVKSWFDRGHAKVDIRIS